MHHQLTQTDSGWQLAVHCALDQNTITSDFWPSLTVNEQSKFTRGESLTVDLVELERADTAGLAWLLNLLRDLNKQGINVTIAHASADLINLARLSGVEGLLKKHCDSQN